MTYIKVRWLQSFSDELILYYSELDENRWNVRAEMVGSRITFRGDQTEILTTEAGLWDNRVSIRFEGLDAGFNLNYRFATSQFIE